MEDVQLPDDRGGSGDLTGAEQAFLDKYVGVGAEELLAKTQRIDPRGQDALGGLIAAPGAPETAGLGKDFRNEDEHLRTLAEVQLVSFTVGQSEFALPITAIQEVIKYVAPTKLPSAPSSISGIINLRGRVTPLLRLRRMLGIAEGKDTVREKFIVVCSHGGLQVGLMVDAVVTMYRALGEDIEWGLESHVGVDARHLAGLLKKDERLISILSIESLTKGVLRSQGGSNA